MRILALLLSLQFSFLAPSLSQSSPIILYMDVEEVQGLDELIAHLRVIEFDSMIGYHIGLQWDTAMVQFLAVEDTGPLDKGSSSFGTNIADAHRGYFHNIWVEEKLECTQLDSGDVLFALRFLKKEEYAVFSLLADTFVYDIGPFGVGFETIGCDLQLKDVFYINNAGDTLKVQNGVIVSQTVPEAWSTLTLFPNPVRDVLHVRGLGFEPGQWVLYDGVGREVRYGDFYGDDQVIEMHGVVPGQYFLLMRTQERGEVVKPVHVVNH